MRPIRRRGHADRQRIGHRPLVGEHADGRLQQRGGELEREGQEPDLHEIEPVVLLEDRIDRRQQRLHHIVDAVADADRDDDRKAWSSAAPLKRRSGLIVDKGGSGTRGALSTPKYRPAQPCRSQTFGLAGIPLAHRHELCSMRPGNCREGRVAKKKIAVVGVGKISQDQHLPVIDKSRDFELAATVSTRGVGHGACRCSRPRPSCSRRCPRSASSPSAPRPASATPIVREAIDAGKDVLLEKPPTPTISEFDDLVAYGEKKGRILFQTWHSQYNDAVDAAKKILKKEGVVVRPHRLARERPQVASRPGLGLGARRVRRLRSGHQRDVDLHQDHAVPGLRREARRCASPPTSRPRSTSRSSSSPARSISPR